MKTFEKRTDEQLITAILQDDHDAQGELYNRYFKKVFQKCLSLMKDPDVAFDLAQDTLIKVFDNLKSFRGESSFSTWLYVITHRQCLAMLRRRNKLSLKLQDSLEDEEANENLLETDEADEREKQEILMFNLIESLPQKEKELLMLKYSRGESIESLQSIFHLSPSAIKMRLKRSREKLNQLYVLASTIGLAEALTQL